MATPSTFEAALGPRTSVRIVSLTPEGRDYAVALLEGDGEPFQRVDFQHVVTGSRQEQARWPRPALAGRQVATVLVLEAKALLNPAYQREARRCLDRIDRKADFRVFLLPFRLGLQDLETMERKDALASRLLQRLQADPLQATDLRTHLADHVVSAWIDLGVAMARGRRRVVGTLVGLAATAMQLLALLLLAAVLVDRVLGPLRPIQALLASFPDVLACLLGILVMPCIFLLAAFALTPNTDEAVGLWSRHGWLFAAQLIVSTGLVFVPESVGIARPDWGLLGVVLGLPIDLTRRFGLRQRWALETVRRRRSAQRAASRPVRVPVDRYRAALEAPPSPLFCPVVPPTSSSVFISYARKSTWGTGKASRLAELLRDRQVPVFLDRTNIPEGTLWFRELVTAIGEAGVVVCVLDQLTLGRGWPADELEAALAQRVTVGLPDIVVLTPAEGIDPSRAEPVFRILLDILDSGKATSHLRAIHVHDGTLEQVVEDLLPHQRRSFTILPASLLRAWQPLLAIPGGALRVIGRMSLLVGIAGGALALGSRVLGHDWPGDGFAVLRVPWVVAILAALAGYAVRTAVAAAGEVPAEARESWPSLVALGAAPAWMALWWSLVSREPLALAVGRPRHSARGG